MKPGMRMLLLADREKEREMEREKRREEHGNYNGEHARSNYSRSDNDMRDLEGRFRGGARPDYHYPEWPDGMTDEAVESRRRYRRREDGTFAPRSEMGDYPAGKPSGKMNVIGFERYKGGSSDYGTRMGYRTTTDDVAHTDHLRGSAQMIGNRATEDKLTKDMANAWMIGLQNEDGTKGPHWTLDQAKQVMQQRGVGFDPVLFWAALNMMYSDYCNVFKKHGVGDRVDFYADMAAAWLDDADGPEPTKKAAAYYECIVDL